MCEFLPYSGPDYRLFESAPTSDELLATWKKQDRRKLPARTSVRARAQLKRGNVDLGWTGGKAGG
jgi:hypothetical protein